MLFGEIVGFGLNFAIVLNRKWLNQVKLIKGFLNTNSTNSIDDVEFLNIFLIRWWSIIVPMRLQNLSTN